MPIALTNWRDRVTPLDALVDGEQQPLAWLPGSTAPVPLDVSDLLAEDETITNVTMALRKLPAFGESDYTDTPTSLAGGPIIADTVIQQRLQNLERGRIYRLEALFGAVDMKRGKSTLVRCTE
jgi:hypothetical protein